MKIFGAVIFFLIAFFAVIVLIALFYVRKGIIRFRQHLTGDYDEETFKRMADKHYRGDGKGPQFDNDYFKGTGSSKKGHAGPTAQQQQKATRQSTTSEGVTVIDERLMGDRKKIFEDNEGEYVEFTEE
jgi:hypothetical protein